MALVRRLLEGLLLPEVWGEVGIGSLEGGVGGLGEVSKSSGLPLGGCVAILDSSHLKKLLWDWGRDDTGTAGSWDEPDHDGGALSSDLARDSVGESDLVSPVSSTDWDDGELGSNNSSTDGSSDFLRALDSESNVSVVVSDSDESLEAGTLSGTETQVIEITTELTTCSYVVCFWTGEILRTSSLRLEQRASIISNSLIGRELR